MHYDFGSGRADYQGSFLIRDHPFKTLANFSRFLTPIPLPLAVFLLLSVGKFGKFLTPLPLKNTDVLNGWSLRTFLTERDNTRAILSARHASIYKLLKISHRARGGISPFFSSTRWSACCKFFIMSTEFDKNISDWRHDYTDYKNDFDVFFRLVQGIEIR